MVIDVREPRVGELWWRKDSERSEDWSNVKRDGLYYYTSRIRGEPFMWRCYSAAADMNCVYHFGQIDFGRPFRWEPYQLVSGEWFLAAEAGQVAAFLREQVEQYKQKMLSKVDKEVAEMTAVIEAGKHPDNLSFKWIV